MHISCQTEQVVITYSLSCLSSFSFFDFRLDRPRRDPGLPNNVADMIPFLTLLTDGGEVGGGCSVLFVAARGGVRLVVDFTFGG